jgi:hypothetical protein
MYGKTKKPNRFIAEKCFLGFGILFSILICYSTPALATTLDLRTGGDGWINGGFFSVEKMNPGGTGFITPFVRLQTNDDYESGTNTLQNPVLDEKPHWLYVYQLTTDNIFTLNGQDYVNVLLDTDEPASKEALNLVSLILYTDISDQKYPYPTQTTAELMAAISWNMDVGGDGDSTVLTDYTLIGGGSGWWGDLSVLIPINLADMGKYFYLYSAFTESDNNPEEWSIVFFDNPPPPPAPPPGAAPEPAPILLPGMGLVGLAGVARKKKKKKTKKLSKKKRGWVINLALPLFFLNLLKDSGY